MYIYIYIYITRESEKSDTKEREARDRGGEMQRGAEGKIELKSGF